VAGAVVATVALQGGGGTAQSRARQYTAFDACLLTDAHGVVGADAAAVWAGMEDASLATHAKVSWAQVYGPATVANAVPYVNTLVQGRCDLVLAVGPEQTAAVEQVAQTAPHVRFVVVGGGHRSGGNVTALPLSSATRPSVADIVCNASKK
jgi:basic membrane lipoprotein Med (substrate-binding protein (PBP1-ABC) superfamily)